MGTTGVIARSFGSICSFHFNVGSRPTSSDSHGWQAPLVARVGTGVDGLPAYLSTVQLSPCCHGKAGLIPG